MPVFQARPPRPHRPRRAAVNPPYALDPSPFNPTWPAILSVAHDTADGSALFVILDRPCVLSGKVLPLVVPIVGGSPTVILAATQILPIKIRVQLNGAVPHGAAWRWTAGPCQLVGVTGGHAPNLAAGDCADVPGPYSPPPPALVVAAGANTDRATLVFDRSVVLNGNALDGSILFDGLAPTAVVQFGLDTWEFTTAPPVSSGSTWSIDAQPAYAGLPVAWPQAGVL